MMRRVGEDAQTNYPWTGDQIAEIHAELSKTRPVEELPQLREERDRNILRLLSLRET